ncbi:mandelate racemase/muconate lactonizing enzyme domain-containing protein [Cavenderia fasciculata]|uniref:Mandelate racemase/muconate lactonizing enzyme domain-containing protein n=1 Tax=Cavenderia fasciculata TaxID=261658 RepID=F4PIZ0_CACFS|nr:mandelate racemase/muconate lactonizing enzyme domain-containing protein [Cavenderia fasciculata]EGG24276.1 mandelate racemase/muconate lactonizing enzyme domain-containing protein [Cavenderia fasciculata]|eukprot:XP_004362127.1 mandelate racemase/muconate lactonizing enzyme domain-containing protein [Cavenderia fasciculata]
MSDQTSFTLSFQPYKLTLRSAFGTAHSVTTVRNNALIKLDVTTTTSSGDVITIHGYGECGVPPKKALCYFADLNDIETYFNAFVDTVTQQHVSPSSSPSQSSTIRYDPFSQLPDQYFRDLRPTSANNTSPSIFYTLLECLDKCPLNNMDYSHASQCAIEMAIFDCWGKYLNLPIYKLASLECGDELKPFYYTVSLCPTMKEILDCSDFGAKYTSFIKIKLDDDVEKGIHIIKSVLEHLEKQSKPVTKISVDANSSWSPASAIKYLEYLKTIKHLISMVEQPFPVETLKVKTKDTPRIIGEWKQIKELYFEQGLPLFADESICTHEDVAELVELVHGVNIKLEKTGGIRGALLAVTEAKKHNLDIWVGSMVGSSLNANAAAHILTSVSNYGGDLDGGLLVDDQSQLFKDGFEFKDLGYIQISSNPGVGVLNK